MYGYDEKVYYPSNEPRDPKRGLTMLFVGVCAVRKGVHYALEAWLRSPASKDGTFLIAGEFLPAYREKLAHDARASEREGAGPPERCAGADAKERHSSASEH